MRYALCLIFVSALMLTACGGGETASPPAATEQNPTAESQDQTDGSEASFEEVIDEILTPGPAVEPVGVFGTEEFELEVPLPGTLVASATEDPEAELIFDSIGFLMQGGQNNLELSIQLSSDGTLVRDGVTSTVPPEDIIEIDNLLDELNFFGVQGTFLGPAPDPNVYRYSIVVRRGNAERLINAQEGFIPRELQNLFARLAQLGEPGPPTPGTP